jgi:antitoxin VapB
MPLNVKNDEAHDLARELSDLTDTTITEAVTLALRETLARERRRRRAERSRRVQDLLQIAAECAELPVVDDRSPDQILDYDDHGAFP